MKKIFSTILCAAMLTSVLTISGLSVSAADWKDYYEVYNNEETINQDVHTAVYYNQESKDIYMSAYDYWHSGSTNGNKYWYYRIGDNNQYEQQMRIANYTALGNDDINKYYKELTPVSESEFDEAFFQYEKNEKLIRIDIDKGFSEITKPDTSAINIDIPNYSYIRNIWLDIRNNNKIKLYPKAEIDSSSIDLKIKWESSDNSIAEVDNEGNVTAKSEGSCTITSEIDGIGTVEEYIITVEPPMTETEKAVKNIIIRNDNQKDSFEEIYNLDDYKAGGHVITDIDGDDSYEMITRSEDRRVIKIYELSGNKIILSKELTGVSKANLIYVFGDHTTKCYFQTLKNKTPDDTEIKIFEYNGPDAAMSNVFTCNQRDTNMYEFKYYDMNGAEITSDDRLSFIKRSWQESFNDLCSEAMRETSFMEVCYPEGKGWAGKQDPYYPDATFNIDDFAEEYFTEGDDPLIYGFNLVHGLRYEYIKQLIINEIIGRYNYKFADPMTTAFMNKKSSYHADPDIKINDIVNSLNPYEKFNYDYLPKLNGGQSS